MTSVRIVHTGDKDRGASARRATAMAAKQQLPPFVVDGEYEDHEWREIAADPEKRTRRTDARFRAGPLVHPYGPNAYLDEKTVGDGTVRRWFPSREERDVYVNTHEAGESQRAEPSPTEGGPEHARASRRGIDSTPRDKARTGQA